LERLAPPGSAYLRDAKAALDEFDTADLRQVVDRLAASAGALRDDYNHGYLRNIEEILHAELFDDFLVMSTELLDKGYKDPAAVIAGSVLEEHLRRLASKNQIAMTNSDGKPRRTEALSEALGKGTYNRLEQKNVTAWLDLRNKAAHGEYDEYDHKQVALLIDSLRSFMARHPA
jgi:hypothetical protein